MAMPVYVVVSASEPAASNEFWMRVWWVDTTGSTVKRYNGSAWVTIADVGGGGGGGPHTHPTSDIEGLDAILAAIDADLAAHDTAIAGKADIAHTHAQSDVTGLVTALAGKADTTHGHIIGDVTGLQTALDGKAASSHTHAQADVTNLTTDLAAKQATSEKGQANGYASLAGDGKVPAAQLPTSGGGGTPANYASLLLGI